MVILLLAVAVSFTAFGRAQSSVPILLSNVRCDGTESSLLSCSSGSGLVQCSYYDDVGVVCPPCKSCLEQMTKDIYIVSTFVHAPGPLYLLCAYATSHLISLLPCPQSSESFYTYAEETAM